MSDATIKPLVDLAKLRIRDGVIHYRIYAQDGSFIPMTIRDSFCARLFVSWVQVHDRYIIHGAKQ